MIDREIGRGGMATVYLARDVRHDRPVALKLLNPELGAVLGIERFLSEIKVTAHLQHPNLLPLFDSGEADGLLFYVMPYVEGESLRHRMEREKQLPVDEAIHIAVAVAHALDYAHSHGVIHRDLKPENILLQHGQPVIADFGIALAVSNAGGGRITQTGLSLGTPQYMSPEQATGDRGIDGRTDVYSLAAVLYEMLAGEAPHSGATAQAVIAKLMTEDARPLAVLRRTVPAYVDAAVQRALHKLPADRFATAGQFAAALTTPSTVVTTANATTATTPDASSVRRTSRVARIAAPWVVAAAGLAAGAYAIASRPHSISPRPVHFTIPLPTGVNFDPTISLLAVSPDGAHLAFTASRGGAPQIYLRSMAGDEVRPLVGTEGAGPLFFSPDGQWIAFRTSEGLKKVALTGGAPALLVKTRSFGGGTWGPNNEIVYSEGAGSGLWRVSANGGEARAFTTPDTANRESMHVSPAFLPGGDAVVFVILSETGLERQLAVATLDGKITRLEQAGSTPTFVDPSYLVFGGPSSNLLIAPFDPRRRRLTGPAVPALEEVYVRPSGSAVYGVSVDGSILAFARTAPRMRLGVLQAGQVRLLPAEPNRFRHLRVSPSGARLAVDILANDGTQDVWTVDVATGALTRLTFDGRSADPVWSPDGARIAFSRSTTTQEIDTYVVAADGSSGATLLVGGPGSQWPSQWLPDGKSFVFDERPLFGGAIHIALLGPDGQRRTIIEAPRGSARLPALSPDGRWIAYTSDESGGAEVYVRPLVGAGRWQVSVGGGTQPVWSRDGKTIYYRNAANVVAASVSMGTTFRILSHRDVAEDRFSRENTINYDEMPGKGLVVVVPIEQGMQFNTIVNWIEEAKTPLKGTRRE